MCVGGLCVYAHICLHIQAHIYFSKAAFWELLPTLNVSQREIFHIQLFHFCLYFLQRYM